MILHSIQFGQQNFLFTKFDDTDVTYDYVGYQTQKKEILLARFTKAGDEGKYYLTVGNMNTVWANHKGSGSPTYVYPEDLVLPQTTDL